MTSPAPETTIDATRGPVVQTTEGLYEGIARGGSVAFLGMPFAAPPVDALRFAAPAPAAAFDGVRQAVEFGATPQRRPWGPDATVPEYVIPGDSTLNVNVFTPAPGDEAALLPVYVWIHGGGYFSGSPACPWYDGSSFNRDGIVTVSISYRLAFDGFGWIEDAPLNRGVLDQIAALEWVAANIRHFGGNPDDVTIGGQSAGGGSVMTLLAAPAARGLFHRAIAHSPAVSHATPIDAERTGRVLASEFGVEPTVAGWSSVPEIGIVARERDFNGIIGAVGEAGGEQSVAAVVDTMRTQGTNAIGLVFAPIADGVVVCSLGDALRDGLTSGVDLLIGTTRDEFVTTEDVNSENVGAALREAGLSDDAASTFDDEVAHIGSRHARTLLFSSQAFRAPLTTFADLRRTAGDGAHTWLFDFAFHSEVNGHATHGYDLPFAWDLLGAEAVPAALGDTPPQALADVMHESWVRFITTGDPGWPSVAESVTGAMRFDVDSSYVADDYRLDAELSGVVEPSAH